MRCLGTVAGAGGFGGRGVAGAGASGSGEPDLCAQESSPIGALLFDIFFVVARVGVERMFSRDLVGGGFSDGEGCRYDPAKSAKSTVPAKCAAGRVAIGATT